MPKFAKTCNNPLHSEFSEGLEGSTIVNLKAFGLLQFAEALAIFLACEKQIKTTKKILITKALIAKALSQLLH